MSSTLPLLKVGPAVALRKETVDVPELGGAVIVRGLTGVEAFAINAIKQHALQRIAEETRAAREKAGEGVVVEPVEPTFQEWKDFAGYVPQLLALAVQGEGGLSVYTAEEWDVAAQHFPAAVSRLQAVAERLSGLKAEDVAKNSPSSPSSAPA